jgi:hypothetical protein
MTQTTGILDFTACQIPPKHLGALSSLLGIYRTDSVIQFLNCNRLTFRISLFLTRKMGIAPALIAGR